jgi:SAM-dependent methyltransferase
MHFAGYYRWLVYRHLFALPAPDATLLDIGTQDGSFLQQFAVQTSIVLDLRPDNLRHAPASGAVCADATRMPFRAVQFDHVIVSDVIEHVERDRALVANATACVRVGGTLWLSTTARQFRLFPGWITPYAERGWGHVRRGYTPQQIYDLVGSDFACELVEWPERVFRHLYMAMWISERWMPALARRIAAWCFACDSRLPRTNAQAGHLYACARRLR